MATQTYQVSSSKTSPASVSPPFAAHSVSVGNNSAAQVTITDDIGGSFSLLPGQTKSVGYRLSPSRWTATAVADGPGSVSFDFSSDYATGDVTPVVPQSQGGNQFVATIGIGIAGANGVFADITVPAGDEVLLYLEPIVVPTGGLALVLNTEFPLPDGTLEVIQFGTFTVPVSYPPGAFFSVGFGKGRPWPLGTRVAVSGPNSGPNWGLTVYGSVR